MKIFFKFFLEENKMFEKCPFEKKFKNFFQKKNLLRNFLQDNQIVKTIFFLNKKKFYSKKN